MQGYYQEKLSDLSLRKCYEIASPRIRRYLKAEIRHILSKINPRDCVLELGCGYGRVLSQLAPAAKEWWASTAPLQAWSWENTP